MQYIISTKGGSIDLYSFDAGWTTYTYATELEEKPQLIVQPDSAGTLWVSQERLLTQEVPMLDGHLAIVRAAVRKLDNTSNKES